MPERRFRVVINDEGHYSVWFAERANPPGWHDEGFTGEKPDCLAHIGKVWQDLNPAGPK